MSKRAEAFPSRFLRDKSILRRGRCNCETEDMGRTRSDHRFGAFVALSRFEADFGWQEYRVFRKIWEGLWNDMCSCCGVVDGKMMHSWALYHFRYRLRGTFGEFIWDRTHRRGKQLLKVLEMYEDVVGFVEKFCHFVEL